jgi:hypothetical protein
VPSTTAVRRWRKLRHCVLQLETLQLAVLPLLREKRAEESRVQARVVEVNRLCKPNRCFERLKHAVKLLRCGVACGQVLLDERFNRGCARRQHLGEEARDNRRCVVAKQHAPPRHLLLPELGENLVETLENRWQRKRVIPTEFRPLVLRSRRVASHVVLVHSVLSLDVSQRHNVRICVGRVARREGRQEKWANHLLEAVLQRGEPRLSLRIVWNVEKHLATTTRAGSGA